MPAGDSVDLGQVTCIEAASADTSTAGDDDASIPAAGEVWVYLVRTTSELDYGTSSAGEPRTASSGDCTD